MDQYQALIPKRMKTSLSNYRNFGTTDSSGLTTESSAITLTGSFTGQNQTAPSGPTKEAKMRGRLKTGDSEGTSNTPKAKGEKQDISHLFSPPVANDQTFIGHQYPAASPRAHELSMIVPTMPTNGVSQTYMQPNFHLARQLNVCPQQPRNVGRVLDDTVIAYPSTINLSNITNSVNRSISLNRSSYSDTDNSSTLHRLASSRNISAMLLAQNSMMYAQHNPLIQMTQSSTHMTSTRSPLHFGTPSVSDRIPLWNCGRCKNIISASHEEAIKHELTCLGPMTRSKQLHAMLFGYNQPSFTQESQPLRNKRKSSCLNEGGTSTIGNRSFSTNDNIITISSSPYCLSALLASPQDKEFLSDQQCFLRTQIEAFTSDEEAQAHVQGRNKPVVLGQVGMRCIHCRHLPQYKLVKGAIYFPFMLTGLYQAAQNMQNYHFRIGCPNMPESVKKECMHICSKKSSSKEGKDYWAKSANTLGLVDTEHGICFAKNMCVVNE